MALTNGDRYIIAKNVFEADNLFKQKWCIFIPVEIQTIEELKTFVEDNYPRLSGQLALVTINKVYNRESVEQVTVTEL